MINSEISENKMNDFGNLAPLMNVVSITGYLNPKLVDDETVSVIAKSTGTPEELVECIVDAVDEVNEMIGNGEDEEVVLKNFSRAIQHLGNFCKDKQFEEPVNCGPVGLSKIAFALHQEDIANFSSSELATQITSYVPANFDCVYNVVENLKRTQPTQTKQNFSRQNYNLATLGKSIADAGKAALKSLGNVKTAITKSPTAKEVIKGATVAKDAVVKAAPGVRNSIVVGAQKGIQAAKAEMPQIKEAGKKIAKEAGQFFKDVVHSPFLMGLDSELANTGRLKGQKVISQTAADFLNKVKGVRAYDLSNATLEADIIKNGVLNTRSAMANAAKQLKKGEISQDYFRSLTKDFQGLLARNTESLKNIRKSSIDSISKVISQNQDFVTKSAELTSKFNSGGIGPESFAKTFENLLKKTTGSFKNDSLYLFRNATDKGKAARDIIGAARTDNGKMAKELAKITKNFEQVEQLVKTELATAVPLATSQLGATPVGQFLASLKALPQKAQQGFIASGLKSCEPAVSKASALSQKADAVLKDAKSVLGKFALVGAGTAIPAGAIYWGLNRDEDKFLGMMVRRAEALKIEIEQLETKINTANADLARERGEIAALPMSKKSGKWAGAYGYMKFNKNFDRQNFALPAPIAAVAKTLLFPIAPAVLIAGLSFVGVAVVQDKLNRVKYRENELETELANLAMKRNELNMQLSQIEQQLKRFHMGVDYLGYST